MESLTLIAATASAAAAGSAIATVAIKFFENRRNEKKDDIELRRLAKSVVAEIEIKVRDAYMQTKALTIECQSLLAKEQRDVEKAALSAISGYLEDGAKGLQIVAKKSISKWDEVIGTKGISAMEMHHHSAEVQGELGTWVSQYQYWLTTVEKAFRALKKAIESGEIVSPNDVMYFDLDNELFPHRRTSAIEIRKNEKGAVEVKVKGPPK